MRAMLIAIAAVGGAGVGLAQTQPAPQASSSTVEYHYNHPSKVEIPWNQLYSFEEVVELCRKLTAAYPGLLTMESIGKSREGRDIYALTLNVAATGPHTSKPGMYIDGNIHGNEVQATEVVLYSIWYLTKSYGKVPKLTELMDRTTFYFIPMVNPDGRARWFDTPANPHLYRGSSHPVDSDGDGLFDEDPPNDLDGDGMILNMRRKDPNGRFRVHPDDPRRMERVPQDSQGDFQRYAWIGSEGIDDDGDGRINEDGYGGTDTNRNWPGDWQPNHIQRGAGEFPLSLEESQAVAKFVLSRPNIAGVQAYHNTMGAILRGPGAAHVEYPRSDLRTYQTIGERGEQIIPFYRFAVIHEDLYTVHGGFINWTYDDLGIISFTNELWTSRKYYGTEERPSQEARMFFNDWLMFGQTYVPWHAVEHPLYGEVEVGGWVKSSGRIAPAFAAEEELHRNFAFTVYHAAQMPLIEFRELDVTSLGGGLYRIRVDVHNTRLIPTTTAQGAVRQYGPRDRVTLSGDGLRVIAGGALRDRVTGPFAPVEHNPQRLWLDRGVGGESYRTFQWLVRGTGGGEIRFRGPRVRDVSISFEIREAN